MSGEKEPAAVWQTRTPTSLDTQSDEQGWAVLQTAWLLLFYKAGIYKRQAGDWGSSSGEKESDAVWQTRTPTHSLKEGGCRCQTLLSTNPE